MEAPKIDYQKLDKQDTLKGGLKTELPKKPWTGSDFKLKKEKALNVLNKINLDDNQKDLSDAEKALKAKFKAHINNEFKTLEHNYKLQQRKLGPDSPEALKARATLSRAADSLIYRLKMSVAKKNIEKGNEKGALAAKIRLIDDFTGVPGFGKHLIEGGGLKKKDLVSIFGKGPKGLPKNKKEFGERLKKILNNEDKVKKGVANIIRKTPKFREVKEGDDGWRHFEDIVNASVKKADQSKNLNDSLVQAGTDNKKTLITTLARRFKVVKTKSGTVDHYVDMMWQNKVFRVINKQEQKRFDDHIRYICHRELNNKDKIKNYNEQIDSRQKEQKKLHSDLMKSWTRDIDDLKDIRKSNQLKTVIKINDGYETQASSEVKDLNIQLAGLKKIAGSPNNGKTGEQVKKISKLLTSDKVKSSPALRKPNALVQIIKLIYAMLKGKNKDIHGLMHATEDLAKGLNPVEMQKKAKDNYAKILDKAVPKPDLLKLMSLHNGEKTNEYFNAQSSLHGLASNKLAQRYPRQRLGVIREHIKKQLSVTGATDLKLGIAKAGMTLNFSKDGVKKSFTLKKSPKAGQVDIVNNADKSVTTADSKWEAIKKVVDKPKPKAADKPSQKKAPEIKASVLKNRISKLTLKESQLIRDKINKISALKSIYNKFAKEFRGSKFKSNEWGKEGRVLKCRKAFLEKNIKDPNIAKLFSEK